MNVARTFRRLMLANLLLSFGCFAVAEANLPGYLALAILMATGWWLSERGAGMGASARAGAAGLPRWVANALLLVAVGVAVARGWLDREPISAFLWLLASILLLKVWERRRLRDYGQLLTISVFMSIGATLSDQSLLLGVMLLVQMPVLVVAVVYYQLFLSSARATGPDANPGRVPGPPIALLTGGAVVVAMAVATAVFLFVPRGIGLHQFAELQQPVVGRSTGFSDSVDLDQSGLISESQTPVMDLRVADGLGRQLGGEDKTIYLRGAVLDQYRGREWVWDTTELPSLHSAVADTSTILSGSDRRVDPAREIVQQVTLRSLSRAQTPMFCVFAPRSVKVGRTTDIRYYPETCRLIAEKLERNRLAYEVRSVAFPEGPAGRHGIRGMASFPSVIVTNLARGLLTSAGVEPDWSKRPSDQDGRAARIFEAYLRTEFAYTLDPPAPPIKKDPIEWFLTDSRRGHCEFFASALAALCRSVGIDARVIAGYMVNEFDPATGAYLVRANDAHAWVEVNTAPGKWETMDATPSATLAALRDQSHGLFGWVTQLSAELRDAWNMKVVTFDAASQDRLLGADTGLGVVNEWFRGRSDEAPSLRSAGTALLVVAKIGIPVALGAALLALFRVWVTRRHAAASRRRAGWAVGRSHVALLRAIEAALESRGHHRRPDWRPLLTHASDPKAAGGELGVAARRGVQALYAARFGGVPLSGSEAARLAADIRRAARDG